MNKFVSYHLIVFIEHQFHHHFICVMHVTLSSNNIVGLPLIEESPHDCQVCWVIDLSHIHLQLVS